MILVETAIITIHTTMSFISASTASSLKDNSYVFPDDDEESVVEIPRPILEFSMFDGEPVRLANGEPLAAEIPVVIVNDVQEGPVVTNDNDNGWNSREGWDTTIATVHNTTVTNSWHSPQTDPSAWGKAPEITNAMLSMEIGSVSYDIGHISDQLRGIRRGLRGQEKLIRKMKPAMNGMEKGMRKDLNVSRFLLTNE